MSLKDFHQCLISLSMPLTRIYWSPLCRVRRSLLGWQQYLHPVRRQIQRKARSYHGFGAFRSGAGGRGSFLPNQACMPKGDGTRMLVTG